MLKLKIVSPERVEYDGDADNVNVPGVKGRFEILTGHAPIISALTRGPLTYSTASGDKVQMDISGGFVSVQKDEVALCIERDA